MDLKYLLYKCFDCENIYLRINWSEENTLEYFNKRMDPFEVIIVETFINATLCYLFSKKGGLISSATGKC